MHEAIANLDHKMEKLKHTMILEEQRTANLNNGCFFIVFRHTHYAQEAIRNQKAFLEALTGASNF